MMEKCTILASQRGSAAAAASPPNGCGKLAVDRISSARPFLAIVSSCSLRVVGEQLGVHMPVTLTHDKGSRARVKREKKSIRFSGECSACSEACRKTGDGVYALLKSATFLVVRRAQTPGFSVREGYRVGWWWGGRFGWIQPSTSP